MHCTRIREQLADYSVGLLDRREAEQVRSHVALCADCRRELHALDRAAELVESYGALEPPPGLFHAVRNRIDSGALRRDRPAWWALFLTTPARATAMGLSIAALALGLLLPAPRPSAPELPMFADTRVSGELASSIRQHALSAGEGPLTDRVAWEAMAQLVTQERDSGNRPGVN